MTKPGLWQSAAVIGLLSVLSTLHPAQAQSTICRLPSSEDQAANPIRIRVLHDANTVPWTVSFSRVPDGFDLENVIYPAWPLGGPDRRTQKSPRPASVWSSYGPLPEEWRHVPWDQVNYLLNHKHGSPLDVLQALRQVTAGVDTTSAEAAGMLLEAENHGTGYVPEPGQIAAVLASAGQTWMLIELVLPWPQPVCPVLDMLWDDWNRNGLQDPGEPPIRGGVIILTDCTGKQLGRTTTTEDGFFFFDLPVIATPRNLRLRLADRNSYIQPTGRLASFQPDGFTACFLLSPDCEWRAPLEPERSRRPSRRLFAR